jgi:hypothetical protein
LFSGCDLGAHAVDVLEEGYVGLEKGGLGGGVDGLHRGDGGVGGGLAAADEVDFGGAGVTGEGDGRGEGDAGGATDWEGVSEMEGFKERR